MIVKKQNKYVGIELVSSFLRELKANMNPANVITLSRIVAVIPINIFALLGYDLLASIVITMAALTDFIDGKIARRFGWVTKIGNLLDPIADHILIWSSIIAVAISKKIIPWWAIVIIILRDIYIAKINLAKNGHKEKATVIFGGKASTVLLMIGAALLAGKEQILALPIGGGGH